MNLMNVVRVIMVSPTATFNNEFEGAAGSPAYLRTGSDGVKSRAANDPSIHHGEGPYPLLEQFPG